MTAYETIMVVFTVMSLVIMVLVAYISDHK